MVIMLYYQGATEDALYRDIFLTTFRTFTTADVLFETLKEFYQQKPQKALTILST